jgi:phage terminase small subunit|tara:strand:+ start:1463 stop:2131 length:669 start_codon:yes stop_codon:yes gene_type:complete
MPKKTKADFAKLPKPLRIKPRPVPKGHSPLTPAEKEAKRSDPRGRKYATADRALTRKQELFVKELVSNDGMITYKEAAVRAGYPESSAHTRAYELTNPHRTPHVVAAIKRYRAEMDERFNITYSRHIRDLQKIRDVALENGAYSAAVQAEYRRGQAQGDIYVNKSEIRHGSIDSMSKDEVLKALKEMKEINGPDIIDITPTEDEDGSGFLSTDADGNEKDTA